MADAIASQRETNDAAPAVDRSMIPPMPHMISSWRHKVAQAAREKYFGSNYPSRAIFQRTNRIY
jgi:hypothetical protein